MLGLLQMIKKIIAAIFLFIIVIIVISFWRFSLEFYRVYSLPSQIEAIVVLTGGKGRLQYALKLLEQSQAKVLFIAGAGTGLSFIFSKEELESMDLSKIYLDQKSQSTVQNALEAKNYMIQQGMSSLVLVTSNYHMKRAFFLFRDIFPSNIEIIPYAIESENFDLNNWWQMPGSLKIAFLEYLKYGWYRFIPIRLEKEQ